MQFPRMRYTKLRPLSFALSVPRTLSYRPATLMIETQAVSLCELNRGIIELQYSYETSESKSILLSSASQLRFLLGRSHAQYCSIPAKPSATFQNNHSNKVFEKPVAAVCTEHRQVLNLERSASILEEEVNLPVVVQK